MIFALKMILFRDLSTEKQLTGNSKISEVQGGIEHDYLEKVFLWPSAATKSGVPRTQAGYSQNSRLGLAAAGLSKVRMPCLCLHSFLESCWAAWLVREGQDIICPCNFTTFPRNTDSLRGGGGRPLQRVLPPHPAKCVDCGL